MAVPQDQYPQQWVGVTALDFFEDFLDIWSLDSGLKKLSLH